MTLRELGALSRGQPCLIVGVFNVKPTKIPCLSKGITAGLWVDLEAAWTGVFVYRDSSIALLLGL